jgi:DNA-binding Lrp family transcriptional regulator
LLRAAPEWMDQPATLLERANRLMYEELSAVDMFITAQLVFVDAKNRVITAASAGHCPGLLTVDARVSNRQIAARLGVTEGTIRGRIRRLEEGGSIRLTAITNIEYFGSAKVVLIGIQAQHSELKVLCQQIAAMPEIGCVIMMLGRFDILAIGLFSRLEDVVEVANNRILALPGVRHVETSIAVKTLKYDYRVAKITKPRKVPAT